MTRDEAIDFLKTHQPMPDTQVLCDSDAETQELEQLVQKWTEALDYFMDHPEKEVIPLFFNSMGDRDGLSAYQSLTHYFVKFPADLIVPYFQDAMRSHSTVVRTAAADCALFVESDNIQFIRTLIALLTDPVTDVRETAINTLLGKAESSSFNWRHYKAALLQAYNRERDRYIKEIYDTLFNL